MNIQDLVNRIRANLGRKQDMPNEAVLGFLRVLEEVRAEELTCDEIYSKLDEYVERQANKHDAAQLMPLIREHLDICPECYEEYEALLKVIEEAER
ncbi:MAG: hypothetical protein AB1607_18450 [Chloroflexota bacterium]